MKSPALTPSVTRGALLMILAAICFACLDALTKYLTRVHAVVAVLFVRYLAHTGLLALRFGPVMGRNLLRSQRWGLQLLRAALLLSTSFFFVSGLRHLPLAEATAIMFLYPILVALLSGLLLREPLSLRGWIAAGCGFLGVLAVVRPGGAHWSLYALLPLAGSLCNAAYMVLTRHFAAAEHPVTSNLITGGTGALVTGLLFFTLPGDAPLPSLLPSLALGALALSGHYLMTLACNHAPAATLAPVAYSQLVFAALVGYLAFGTLPDHGAVIGMAIIIASGAYLLQHARKASTL